MLRLHMKTYTFQITQDLHDKLKKISKREQRTQSAMIRFLLEQHFKKTEVKNERN